MHNMIIQLGVNSNTAHSVINYTRDNSNTSNILHCIVIQTFRRNPSFQYYYIQVRHSTKMRFIDL